MTAGARCDGSGVGVMAGVDCDGNGVGVMAAMWV